MLRHCEVEDQCYDGIHGTCKGCNRRTALDMAIEALSAEAVPQSEQYKKGFEDAKRAFLVEYARESQNMRKRNAQLEVMLNAQKMISADKPRGTWISVNEKLPDDGKWAIWCSNNGIIGIARFKEDYYNHFYPNETSFDLEDAVAWMPLPEPYK